MPPSPGENHILPAVEGLAVPTTAIFVVRPGPGFPNNLIVGLPAPLKTIGVSALVATIEAPSTVIRMYATVPAVALAAVTIIVGLRAPDGVTNVNAADVALPAPIDAVTVSP